MQKEGGLSKAEREMIVVATSGANDCLYCIVAHGAILRIYAKNPLVADQVAVNYRKADITPRQKAMLAFALKVAPRAVDDRRRRLRRAARARIHRRGHLGHRRDRRVLRAVEPDGQHDRHAAQRRVLPDGPRAAEQVRKLASLTRSNRRYEGARLDRPPFRADRPGPNRAGFTHSISRYRLSLNHASILFHASSASAPCDSSAGSPR